VSEPDEDDRERRSLKLLLALNAVLIVGLFVFVWLNSWATARHTVEDVRAGCVRDVQRSTANADGWREARRTRQEEGDSVPAARYLATELRLRKLAAINCDAEYPMPTPFDLRP
jgi:hypothetical protein